MINDNFLNYSKIKNYLDIENNDIMELLEDYDFIENIDYYINENTSISSKKHKIYVRVDTIKTICMMIPNEKNKLLMDKINNIKKIVESHLNIFYICKIENDIYKFDLCYDIRQIKHEIITKIEYSNNNENKINIVKIIFDKFKKYTFLMEMNIDEINNKFQTDNIKISDKICYYFLKEIISNKTETNALEKMYNDEKEKRIKINKDYEDYKNLIITKEKQEEEFCEIVYYIQIILFIILMFVYSYFKIKNIY